MSLLLAVCLVGGAVFAKLPTDHPPTLRQAIVAAGVSAPSEHVSNADKVLASWSYECDGSNYAAAYYVAGAAGADASRLWIARYDDGKKTWSEASTVPPDPSEKAQAQQVITLFYDGYYLYVQLEDASGAPATLQFGTDLSYKREFFGKTWAGLTDFSLFYEPDTDALPGDPLGAIFDPVSGKSRAIFPPATPTETIERGEQLEAKQFATCGQNWFGSHGLTVDPKEPFRGLAAARSNPTTDSLAFAVVYGSGYMCAQAPHDVVAAIYVVAHPDDPKRMKFVEQPLADVRHLDTLDLGSYLTKQSLAKLFGSS